MDELQVEFNEWVAEVLPHEPIEGVVAYNFNIYESDDEYLVEIIGANTYTSEDDDWAAEEIWTSGPLMFILPYAEFGIDWEDIHELVATLTENLLETDTESSLFLRDSQAITVGFIDADLELVWVAADE